MERKNIMSQRSLQKQKRRWAMIALLLLSLTLSPLLSACSANKDSGDTDSTQTNSRNNTENTGSAGTTQTSKTGQNQGIVVSAKEVSTTPKFYPATVDGTRMEIFAVKASDGSIRTAFNTCQVCNGSPKAYFQPKGDTVQCQNCGNTFPMDRIGMEAGGCNPVPISDDEKITKGDTITIPYDVLQTNAYRFPGNWKQ